MYVINTLFNIVSCVLCYVISVFTNYPYMIVLLTHLPHLLSTAS